MTNYLVFKVDKFSLLFEVNLMSKDWNELEVSNWSWLGKSHSLRLLDYCSKILWMNWCLGSIKYNNLIAILNYLSNFKIDCYGEILMIEIGLGYWLDI